MRERKRIVGSESYAPSGDQGQCPWSRGQGWRFPLKPEAIEKLNEQCCAQDLTFWCFHDHVGCVWMCQDEVELCSATAQFESFVLQFLDRLVHQRCLIFTSTPVNNNKQICIFVPSVLSVPSVLRRCWLGGRKVIRPVKNWVVWWWRICLEPDADLHTAQLMPLPLTVSCFSKIQMVLPFWYWLTQVVPDKGLLNGCKQICIAHKVVTSEASCFNTWFIYFGIRTAGLVRIDRPKHKRGKYNTITVLQYTHTPV